MKTRNNVSSLKSIITVITLGFLLSGCSLSIAEATTEPNKVIPIEKCGVPLESQVVVDGRIYTPVLILYNNQNGSITDIQTVLRFIPSDSTIKENDGYFAIIISNGDGKNEINGVTITPIKWTIVDDNGTTMVGSPFPSGKVRITGLVNQYDSRHCGVKVTKIIILENSEYK